MAVEKKSNKIKGAASKGGARPGAGRPRGLRNRKTREVLEAVEAAGETPLQYMLRVMRDPFADAERRDRMAAHAAPYVHPKLANLNHSGQLDIKGWTDDQLAAARAIFAALAKGESG